MKIAFWNTGGMGNTSDKLIVVDQWVRNNDPDILLFEEISATLENTAAINGLNKVLWVVTLDKNGGRSTKDLAVFAKPGVALKNAAASEMPYINTVNDDRERKGLFTSDPRRKLCEVSFHYSGEDVFLYGLHANSSYSGGATAVACMNKFIEENDKFNIIAGGDFNSDRDGIGLLTKKIVPLDHQGKPMQFTQWNKDVRPGKYNKASFDYDDTRYTNYCNKLSLAKTDYALSSWTNCVLPHDVIDYVLCSTGLPLKALPNCADGAEWLSVLKAFDHAPVLFQL